MNIQATSIPYRDTHSFSRLVLDYIDRSSSLSSLITAFPSESSLRHQIEHRVFTREKRDNLHRVISAQYDGLTQTESVRHNINALLDEFTFTVCTAHQPLIFTGHLYFIYKIIHAIKLAAECKALFPRYSFVPVYYMGSEDNDLDEIGHLFYQDKRYTWTTSQRGACGRMDTGDLKPILDDVLSSLNKDVPDEQFISDALTEAYRPGRTLSESTRILVNALFGRFGLLVLDADDPVLKRSFMPVMKDDLREHTSHRIVNETIQRFPPGYTAQAHPRSINLFYLQPQSRERIERDGAHWYVVQTARVFSEQEILDEMETHPEHFSPNVILRPLYQESILPNIAFVGGGGELAYWLELKDLFSYHGIEFPLLFLRNSVAWIDRKSSVAISKLKRPVSDFFSDRDLLIHELLDRHDVIQGLQSHIDALNAVYTTIQSEAAAIAPQLGKSVAAHQARISHIHARLRQKFMNQLKKQSDDLLQHIDRVRACLFPSGVLQERQENLLTMYKRYGMQCIEQLMLHQDALGTGFLLLEEKEEGL